MKKLNTFIFLFSLIHLCSFAQIKDKINVKIRQKENKTALAVVVILNEQADVSAVSLIRGKEKKTEFVYRNLLNVAEKSQSEVIDFLNAQNIPFRSYYIVNMIALKADFDLIEKIATLGTVKEIIEDGNFMINEPKSDRISQGSRSIEWNLSKINAPAVWALGYTGQNVVIGGQDTGYKWDHNALKNKYRGWNGSSANFNYNWHDAIHEDNPLSPGTNSCGFDSPEPCDDHNHGTHTMGTMVGDDGGSNQIGVAPGSKWIGCRNMENGYGTLSTYVECFEWFLAPYGPHPDSLANPSKMPHVINNSWGCPTEEGCNTSNFATMELALNNLRNAGCVIVVSAGNAGSSCSTVNDPPAIFSGSFSVGSTTSTDAISSFSSRGPVIVDGSNRLKPNIAAPGSSVRSSIKNGDYASFSGTSMAGPHIAGLVALLISANPQLAGEVDLIEDIIEQTSLHITSSQECGGVTGSAIPNNTFGYGRADALAAVNMALITVYIPFLKTENDFVTVGTGSGLILSNTNNQKYRISVNNSGQLLVDFITMVNTNTLTLANTSLNINSVSAGIILKAPNNSFWRLSVSLSGALITTSLGSLPPTYVASASGDLYIKEGLKGLVCKDTAGNCYLINVSTLGTLLTIPTVCTN
ncbi:MAG: S8 family serine peptidase [Saprospiraceae bacterium]|nr:S8 family serine peptidase [Saprospiraceae bacterium]